MQHFSRTAPSLELHPYLAMEGGDRRVFGARREARDGGRSGGALGAGGTFNPPPRVPPTCSHGFSSWDSHLSFSPYSAMNALATISPRPSCGSSAYLQAYAAGNGAVGFAGGAGAAAGDVRGVVGSALGGEGRAARTR